MSWMLTVILGYMYVIHKPNLLNVPDEETMRWLSLLQSVHHTVAQGTDWTSSIPAACYHYHLMPGADGQETTSDHTPVNKKNCLLQPCV